MFLQRDAGLVIQIIEMVIVPFEFSVCSPYIRCLPIIDRICIVDVFSTPSCPFQTSIFLIIFRAVYRSPTIIALLSSYPNETASSLRFFLDVQPVSEFVLELIVPHVFCVKWKIFFSVTTFRHLTDPDVLACIVPRSPELLVHRGAGYNFERYADPVNIQNVRIRFEYSFYVLYCFLILYLIVHMEDRQFPIELMFPNVIDAEIQ